MEQLCCHLNRRLGGFRCRGRVLHDRLWQRLGGKGGYHGWSCGWSGQCGRHSRRARRWLSGGRRDENLFAIVGSEPGLPGGELLRDGLRLSHVGPRHDHLRPLESHRILSQRLDFHYLLSTWSSRGRNCRSVSRQRGGGNWSGRRNRCDGGWRWRCWGGELLDLNARCAGSHRLWYGVSLSARDKGCVVWWDGRTRSQLLSNNLLLLLR